MRRFSTKSMSSMNTDAIMASPPTQRSAKSSPRDYDTGFPEPFCGTGNTTRRHPDANVAPGACISGADIDVNRVLQRSRRSFMTKSKHKYTVNYGKLAHGEPLTDYATPAAGSIYDDNQLPRAGSNGLNRPTSAAQSDGSAASISLQQPSCDDETMRNANLVASSHSHRSGFLRKLRIRE